MTFKDTPPQFQMLDVTLIDPDPSSPRKHIDEAALKALANSIRRKGVIHPLVVQPANPAGRHVLIVGERRWRAAVMAGETAVPALVRPCDSAEALEVQVFENLGMGMRAPLEARDMANAIHTIAERFESRAAALEHFGGTPSWLNQATAAAAANLSPKITALLDSGQITSTGAAVKLEKLTQKNEAKAEAIIGQIEQLPEGEKLPRKIVDRALSEAAGRRKAREEDIPGATQSQAADTPPWEEAPSAPASGRRLINADKVKLVAEILGVAGGDEEEILARLIDEFLELKGERSAPF